jgi:hypothetical protein
MWVRLTAHWLTHGLVADDAPSLSGTPVIDALVAAAVAEKARRDGVTPPAWTNTPERYLETLWNPSGPRFFAWSLAHAPAEFRARGVLIEADSLVSV